MFFEFPEEEYVSDIETIKECIKDDPRYIFECVCELDVETTLECINIAVEKLPWIILEIITTNKNAFRKISFSHMEDFICKAIKKDVEVFNELPEFYKTYLVCLIAVDEDVSCIDNVPYELIDERLSLIVLNSKKREYYKYLPQKYTSKPTISKKIAQ